MYMLNMVIILIVMYSNVVTAIDKIPTYLLRFNSFPHIPETATNDRITIRDRSTVQYGVEDNSNKRMGVLSRMF